MVMQNMFTRDFAQADQAAAEQAAAVRRNLETFERMFLWLGPDCLKLGGTAHDSELMEAKAVAAGRWSRLLDLEAQVHREEQNLAARPRKGACEPADKMLAAEVIKRFEAEFAAQTDVRRPRSNS